MANGSTSSKKRMQDLVNKVNGPTDPPKEIGAFYPGSVADRNQKNRERGTWNMVEGYHVSKPTKGVKVVSTKGSGGLTEGTPIRRTKTGEKEYSLNTQRSTNTAWYDKPEK